MCYCCSVTKSCPTLWDPMDCSLLGSSVHGILQTRTLERVAAPFSTTQWEYHYFKRQMSNEHGSIPSSPPPANQLQAQILFKYWAGCLAACLSLDFRPWPVSASHCSSRWTLPLSLLLPELSLSLIVSQSAPVSLNTFISVALCVLVWFSFFLFVSVPALVSHSVSFYFPPLLLALSLLISLALFLSLTFGLCVPSVTFFLTLSLCPIPLSTDFPCPLGSSQSCFLREAQFLSLRLFLIVSTALLVTSSLSFSVCLLVFLLFHSPIFSHNQMSLLGKSGFQSKGFRVLIKPSCWGHLQALRDWTQSHGGPLSLP